MARGRARPAFVLAALLAMLLQAVLVPTHIHTPFAVAAELSADDAPGSAHVQATIAHDRDQVGCVLCPGLATARSAVLPAVSTIAARERFGEAAAAAVLQFAPPSRAHFWRSRAPPSRL